MKGRPGVLLGRIESYKEIARKPGRSGGWGKWIGPPFNKYEIEAKGGGHRKSEVPIVAMKPGNSGGAKVHRFGKTSRAHMARHRADSDHDKET